MAQPKSCTCTTTCLSCGSVRTLPPHLAESLHFCQQVQAAFCLLCKPAPAKESR